MKKIIIIALLFAFTSISYSQMGMMIRKSEKVLPFISTWTTTAAPQTITLPLLSTGGQYDFTIDWGDGTVERITTNSAQHTYSNPDTYTITISGLINGWKFNNGGDKNKIRDISQWGCLKGAGKEAFYGCSNLDVSATDQLDTRGITSFAAQFAYCGSLTTLDVSDWDVSEGTNFDSQFRYCTSLTTLDVSNWDVDNGTIFGFQFLYCSSLTTLDVSDWDVSEGTYFKSQFSYCSSLTTLDVSDWDVSSGTNFTFFMFDVTMTTSTYNQTLINWDALTLQPGAAAQIHFGNSKYNTGGAAETARTNIINNDGWNIIDGGGI